VFFRLDLMKEAFSSLSKGHALFQVATAVRGGELDDLEDGA